MSVVRKIKRKGNIILNSDDFIEFLKKYNLYNYPLDVKLILEYMRNILHINILINDEDELEEYNYSFSKISDIYWLIKLDKNKSKFFNNYLIAVCLGHYILHRILQNIFEDDIFFIGHDCIDKNTMKYEAMKFANEILMPEEKIREFVENGFNTIEKLATKFNTTESIVRFRLKELGVIR